MPDENKIIETACLYVVGMPLGNQGDLSPRAREILSAVDRIACEDTRVTALQLSQVGIKNRLISYHEHNRAKREPELLDLLRAGEAIALVSDAGMPAISDPGQHLVAAVAAADLAVSVIPGPTAAMTALAASGLDSRRFVFEGFLEVKGRERRERLEAIALEPRTVLLYEAPHRMLKTLADLVGAGLGERQIVAGRELTKRYEEYLRMTVADLLHHYEQQDPRGEYTLVLEGLDAFIKRGGSSGADAVEPDEIHAFIRKELDAGTSVKGLTQILTERYSYKKNTAYNMILTVKDEEPVI